MSATLAQDMFLPKTDASAELVNDIDITVDRLPDDDSFNYEIEENEDNRSYASYKQCDSAWGSNGLGVSGCGETICSVGCAMTSVAMMLNDGKNPGSLNSWLKNNGGYSGCLIVWSAVNSLGKTYVGKETSITNIKNLFN